MRFLKHQYLVLFSLLAIFSISSLSATNYSKSFQVKKVDHLKVDGPFKVHFRQAKHSNLTIESASQYNDNLKVHYSNGALTIKDVKANLAQNEKTQNLYDIYLDAPSIKSIELSGSGTFITKGSLNTKKLVIDVFGSYKINADLFSDELVLNTKGSSQVKMSGEVIEQHIQIFGSSSYSAYPLHSSSSSVTLKGSGKVMIHAQNKLSVKVYGSGKVFYKGKPKLQTQIYGSGKVLPY